MNNSDQLFHKIENIGVFVKIDSNTFFCEEPNDEKLLALSIDVEEDKDVEKSQIKLLKEVVGSFDELISKTIKYYESSEFYSEEMGALTYVDISIYSHEDEADFCIQADFVVDEESFIEVEFKNMKPVAIYGND
jgi:hypothetical protein